MTRYQTPCPNCGSLHLEEAVETRIRLANPGSGYHGVVYIRCQECGFEDKDVPLIARLDFSQPPLKEENLYGSLAQYAAAVANYRAE